MLHYLTSLSDINNVIFDPYEQRKNSGGQEKTVCHGIDLVFDLDYISGL